MLNKLKFDNYSFIINKIMISKLASKQSFSTTKRAIHAPICVIGGGSAGINIVAQLLK